MTAVSPEPAVEPSTTTPPRFRWLLRGTATVVAVAAVLVAIWIWWGHTATARVHAAIAAARARGEPATIDDFNEPPVTADPDDGNAANLIARAAAAVVYTPAESTWDNTWDPAAPLTPGDRATLAGIVAANARPIRLARQAVGVPAANWGVHIRRPILAAAMPSLNRQRSLAGLLRQAAIQAHDVGDDATAVDDLRAILRESDAMATDAPFVLTHLVAVGINAVGTDATWRAAGELRLDDPPTRPTVEALIRQLANESAYAAGGRRQAFGERLVLLDIADDPASALPNLSLSDGPLPALLWSLRPTLKMSAAKAFTDYTAVAAAVAQPTWPAARQRMLPSHRSAAAHGSDLDAAGSWLLRLWEPDLTRAVETHFRGLTDRRAAATLLAVRLYAADHAGRVPPALADLVPRYLPAVPTDPMSPDAHPLRWLPGRGVLYSVGADGTDDGGSTVLTRRPSWGTPSPWDMKDAVYNYRARARPTTGVTPGS